MTVVYCVLGIRLAEVSALPHEIINDAKQICQQITEQQEVFLLVWSFEVIFVCVKLG